MQLYQPNIGFVYVFENLSSKRIKVGKTIDNIEGRLIDLNQYWLDLTVTCQVCGTRLNNKGGYIPYHVLSGVNCHGGGELPLEKDVSIAMQQLENFVLMHSTLTGAARSSSTRKINTLEKRIAYYSNYRPRRGLWEFRCAYLTKKYDQVESESHKILEDHLDTDAPMGEVFNCLLEQAIDSIENALDQLGLLGSEQKITSLRIKS